MRQSAISLAVVSLLAFSASAVHAENRRGTAVRVTRGVVAAAPAAASTGAMFWLDSPAEDAKVAGAVEVRGWIIDDRGVSNIDLYVDGVFTASADLNLPRYDVLQAYPWYSGTINARPGFSTSFNADDLTDGAHTIFLRITFSNAAVQDFGTRTVIVDKSINQAPFGEIDMPGPAQPMDGVFPVTGWALDDGVVTKVEVLVDGQVIGQANTGMPRPDVENRFPALAGSGTAGFVRMLNTTTFSNGVHTVAARLWDDEGASRVIGQRFVQIFNNGRNLPPFGRIEWPIANHYLSGDSCSQALSTDNGISPPDGWVPDPTNVGDWEMVSGWALDVGSRTDNGGVKWVELYLDGAKLANTLVDDYYLDAFSMVVNVYGLERPDIMKLFPGVPNAKDSGFAFAINPADLAFSGFHQGLHYLTVRAGDIEGFTANIATIPVVLSCTPFSDAPSFGDIYTPDAMERVAGTVAVTGWAFDRNTVRVVEILVDGVSMGTATFPLDSPEIAQALPWFSYLTKAGYHFDLDTTLLTDGQHTLAVRTEDRFGFKNFIGQRTFVVDNLNSGQ